MFKIDKSFLKIANILTLVRLILGFIIASLILEGKINTAIVLMILGFITDVLDGYLARKLKQESKYGRNFDTATDTTFLLLILITLGYKGNIEPTIIILLILGAMIKGLNYLVKKKIEPSMLSKITIPLVYILIIISMISPEIYNKIKFPIIIYHLSISILEFYKTIHRKI